MGRVLTAERRRTARTLVLSGSFARRVAHLERLSETARWTATVSGTVIDVSSQILALLQHARRHAATGRYVAAVEAWEAADRLAGTTMPTHAEARVRAINERTTVVAQQAARQRAVAARAGGEEKRRKAGAARRSFAEACLETAKEYRRLHPTTPITAVIAHVRRRRDIEESDATIRRWLRDLGLK